jgi:acetoin utilization deacetylase AcuC-like enzyme
MDVTPEGFATLTSLVMKLAQSCCQGKLVVTLEGGYHLGGLKDSVKTTLKELTGNSVLTDTLGGKGLSITTERIMEEVRKVQKDFWTAL